MKMLYGNKKGLESYILVFWIIGILALALIVYFIISTNQSNNFDKEACHQAVVYRGSINEALDNGAEIGKPFVDRAVQSLKLKCQTEDIEISETEKQKILGQISDEMISCWQMLGEGKINFFGRGWTEENRCVICSKFKFSDKAKQSGIVITNEELNNYMMSTNIPGKEITYFDFLAGAKEHVKRESLKDYSSAASAAIEMSIDDAENSEQEIIDIGTIDPVNGGDYVIVYRLWQTDKLWPVAAGLAAAGTTYTAKTLLKKEIKDLFKKKYIKDDYGIWREVDVVKVADGYEFKVSADELKKGDFYKFGTKMSVDKPVPVIGYKTPQGLWVSESKLPNVNWQYKGGNQALYVKGIATEFQGAVKNNIPITQVKLGKPKVITSFGGSVATGLLTSIVNNAGNIATIFAYIGASKTVDEFKGEKYFGQVMTVEYASDSISDLGCTNLDVVP